MHEIKLTNTNTNYRYNNKKKVLKEKLNEKKSKGNSPVKLVAGKCE